MLVLNVLTIKVNGRDNYADRFWFLVSYKSTINKIIEQGDCLYIFELLHVIPYIIIYQMNISVIEQKVLFIL